MCTPEFLKTNDQYACIIFIGMAAAGKSTISKKLAANIGWALADTDHIIEAKYATSLQNVADAMSKDEFLDLEAACIKETRLSKTVIATGGSVVYRHEAMEHLASLGTIIHIKVDLPIILERIALTPNRGLAIAEGQTIEDLFYERESLYTKYAHHVLEPRKMTVEECVEKIKADIPLESLRKR